MSDVPANGVSGHARGLRGDAGFPPLMLDPMDFGALYQQQLAARAQEQQQGAGAPAGEA